MMPHMMNGAMMSGLALFWIVTGILFFLLLVTMLLWLFTHWMNAHTYAPQPYATRPLAFSQRYEQGYQPQALETYQEGGSTTPPLNRSMSNLLPAIHKRCHRNSDVHWK